MKSQLRRTLLFAAAAAPAGAQTIFVDTQEDSFDFGGAYSVADLPGPDGRISMREACEAANQTPGPQTIGFHIPASEMGMFGWNWAALRNEGSAFQLHDPETTVDGSTQTAFTGDTNPNGPEVYFYNAHPAFLGVANISVYTDRCTIQSLGSMLNRGYGIELWGQDNVVEGCAIHGPLYAAVRVLGNRNRVGGTAAGQGNELSSGNDGLRIENGASANLAFGNTLERVLVRADATNNRIGGFAPGEANAVHGSGSLVAIESAGNHVLGNFVGVHFGATGISEGGTVGIALASSGNIVRGNVIGGCGNGLTITGAASGNLVQGNWIGTNPAGTLALPNGLGVQVYQFPATAPSPQQNRFGGTQAGEPNVVANNPNGGFKISGGSKRIELLRNSIHSNHLNQLLGIDLGSDGPTANDVGDADAGANDFMNTPVLRTAVSSSTHTTVSGTLDTPLPQTARIELFANPAPSFGEIVEGKQWLGDATPLANGFFLVELAGSFVGQALSATATDALGNTSEFALPILVKNSPWSDLGQGLAGTGGVPQLVGAGALLPNQAFALHLKSAKPSSNGWWVYGANAIQVPLLGGVLVPNPTVLATFQTDPSGTALVPHSPWISAGSGSTHYIQAWIVDPGAVQFAAASNAILGIQP
jgi:Right handed beta helix region